MLGASDEMRQYANSVGMSIEKMEKFNEQAKASAYPLQALKANIKGIGKAFLSYSIQFAAFWGVSKIIEWVVNGIDAQVNALNSIISNLLVQIPKRSSPVSLPSLPTLPNTRLR